MTRDEINILRTKIRLGEEIVPISAQPGDGGWSYTIGDLKIPGGLSYIYDATVFTYKHKTYEYAEKNGRMSDEDEALMLLDVIESAI